ncbi:MAG: RluA family pseudouridine synthase [Deferribacteraceae bacterium]|jgi:23S rRNA pseudouridine1911/1915/1917 synthase|nr:RluA family pseudouridine synthase [Deferribacteraceae bacterium]
MLPLDTPLEFINEIDMARADACLASKLGISRSYAAVLIESGYILVNGKRWKKSRHISLGAHISVEFPKEEAVDITPKDIPFDILLDEPKYTIINKPSGIAVHPGPAHLNDTLVNGLLFKLRINDADAGVRPGIVHRLDKDTSGLMIVTKDRQAREVFGKLFSDRKIDKYYLCIAHGKTDKRKFVIDAPIRRDKIHRKRMGIYADGRESRSEVEVLEEYKKGFLAEVKLCTGRTHQIRVHFKHIKHPLIGDELYGGKSALFHRQALHSHRLVFTDPFNGKAVNITSDIPDDMKELKERLAKQ